MSTQSPPLNYTSTPHVLAPPLRLPTGSIVTIKMRGHVRTGGLDYYAPAVVLEQYMPGGEIAVIVWDTSAGTHYNPNYAIRELGVRGDGNEREVYEVSSNVQDVLFSPEEQMEIRMRLDSMQAQINTQNALLAEMAKSLKLKESKG